MKKKNYTILYLTLALLLVISVPAALAEERIRLSLVNQNPDPATAGDVVELRIGVGNQGDQVVNNLIVEVSPGYPFEIPTGELSSQTIESIGAYQYDENMQVLKFKVKINDGASEGTYNLNVRYKKEGDFSYTSEEIPIEVSSSDSAEVIHIDKTVLIPGKEDTLKFVINNVGNAPLKDLKFSWQNDDKIVLPVGSDNTKHISKINVGESAELEYKVIADTNADAGLYELTLNLQYESSTTNTVKTVETFAGIYVGGPTDFDLAFSENNNGEYSFTVANIGSNDATSVAVKIPSQDGWKTTGTNSQIIGNLNKGDYTLATFKLSSTPKSSDSITINIDYTDTKGERLTVSKDVILESNSAIAYGEDGQIDKSNMPQKSGSRNPVRAMGNANFNSAGSAIIKGGVILLVLIVGIVGYKFWKKSKTKLRKK